MKNRLTESMKLEIIEDHKKKMPFKEIYQKYNLWPSTVQNIITIFDRDFESEYFNVDKLDCWIIPTTYEKND